MLAEIASGGMGSVYVCRAEGDGGFERIVAIKLLHPHLATNVDFVSMFLDEARLAARIHHHNVVGIHELGIGSRGHFIVMDYIEGCSLGDLLRANPAYRPPDLIAPIMIGALNGLHAAHTQDDEVGKPLNIVHRDMSPRNVLIGVDGTARIADFGVAKARARITSSSPNLHKGTLAYSAPEQLRAECGVDPRTDLFAAGVVMWTALTGRNLFQAKTVEETLNRLLRLKIPPPSRVGLHPPDCFDKICLRALDRIPDKRFESAFEMADELRHAAAKAGLLGHSTDVAGWIHDSFAEEIESHRTVVREAIYQRRAQSTEDLPIFAQARREKSDPISNAETVEFLPLPSYDINMDDDD